MKLSKFAWLVAVLFLVPVLFLVACDQNSSKTKTIGIIVPIEHKAMDEIVAGFSSTLTQQIAGPIKIKVANAQGDLNLQRSIIQQMKDANYDLIVPIGKVATEMSVNAVRGQPILSLAAMYSQAEREQKQPCNMTVVHDEISSQKLLDFIHTMNPSLTRLTLVHSASDKIYPEVKDTIAVGKALGITIVPKMANTLNDLYSISTSLPADSQGILVLKDHLIASGISVLERVAGQKKIPLITSDEGTVIDGAGVSLGVHEKEIGIAGAHLAAQILAGKPACSLPMVDLNELTVFTNTKSLAKQNQSLPDLQQAAKRLHYRIEEVSSDSAGETHG